MALLSNYLQRQRLMKVRPYLRGRILDIGCGDASLVAFLTPQQSYTGIDVNADVVERHRARYSSHRFFAADLDQSFPALSDGAYDTIVLCAVVEHLRNPETLLDQLYPALTDDGRLVVTTPTPLGGRIHRVGAFMGLFSHEAVEEHEKIYSRKELERLMSEHGFVVENYGKFNFGLNHLLVARRLETH